MSTAENTAADAPEYAPILSPLMQVHGAFAADGPDTGIAAHYGDPLAEQRALARDRGATTGDPVVVDRSSLGVVRVSGPDRASWLTSLASQILTDMNSGDSREFLMLSPQGRIEYAPAAVEDGQALWLIVEGAQAEPLTDYLNRMKFMLRVDIENMSGEYAVIETARNPRGEQGAIHPVFADALIWRDPWTALVEGGYHYSATPDAHPGTDYERYLSIIPREKHATLTEGAQLAGVWAAEALRIEAWRRAQAPKSTIKPFRKSWTTPAPPCTSRKDATRDKKPSRVCTTWGIHRAAWSFSTLTALSTPCPQRAANSS